MVMRKTIVVLIICIMLLVSFLLGCVQEDGPDEKKPNEEPIADIGPSFEVLSMTEIQFSSANCTDPDGEIVSYDWDFDDYRRPGDETSSEANPKYTYDFPGVFTVSLTVTDDDGATAYDTLKVTVLNRQPVIAPEVGESVIAKVFEVIYFNGSADDLDGYLTEYEWDFDGDDDYDWFATTTGSTTHFYEEPGEYKAIFTVTDNLDAQSKAIKNVTIKELIKVPPIADAGKDQIAPIGQVLLKGTGFDPDGNIVLYEWDFDGDGTYDWSSEITGIVNHTYTTEGVFNAKLRVTDDSELTAADIIRIEINNSLIAQAVSAQIFINWSGSYDYRILLNDTINTSKLKVIITDIITSEEEEFGIGEITELNFTNYILTSSIEPEPKHSIQVEVFYYNSLIGARSFEIVNQSYEHMGPEIDFQAIYYIEQFVEQHNIEDTDLIQITSIGDLTVEHSGSLFYTSLHGTGLYYVYESFEDGDSEMNINCTDLWVNITVSGSEIISRSMSFTGHGTMEATYEEAMNLDMDILDIRLVTENDVEIENYMYGEGTFTGSGTDPGTSTTVSMEGDVYFTSELLGTDTQNNWANVEYPCTIQRVNITLEGDTWMVGGLIKTQFSSTVVNTTWNVDYEKYSNNTIYYEYTSMYTVANLDPMYDAGSGYPENHPMISEPEVHIDSALIFDTPRPLVLTGEDFMILESEEGVKLQLTVIDELETKINNKNYECVVLRGVCVAGATGYVETKIIKSGSYRGLMVFEVQDFRWEGERISGESELKSIK